MRPGLRLLRVLGGAVTAVLAVGGLLCVAGVLVFFTTVSNLPRVPVPLRRIIDACFQQLIASCE